MNTMKIGMVCSSQEFINETIVASLLTFQKKRIKINFETRALELFQTSACNSSSPDIILLDIDIPDICGIEVIDIILSSYPACSVIIITDIEDKDALIKYIHAGAKGCIKKDVNQNKLISAIHAVMNGGCYISPTLTRLLFEHFKCTRKLFSELSFREQQIVEAIVEGLSYKLVAYRYNISIDTVRFYVKKIYKKLNINSKGELLALTRLNTN